jgi:hypothetical protein
LKSSSNFRYVLAIAPPQKRCLHATRGSPYLPPFGRVGAILDQLVLHQVAHATLRRFLTRLATTATSMARTPTSETEIRPTADRHAWETGT